ncbi:MOSC domain-containing protein [Deinococcus sonorensis]|uniref:MOSC domain-containing protein n=2 Tax=Deinococcus sonorensis TaxID=309891 RepID=A0AAU7UAM1_9DEIO
MKLLSVNIGRPTEIRHDAHRSISGIDKRPQSGPVRVGPLGLEGDHILSTGHHGGPDQAVYLYSTEDYDAFVEQLGHPLPAGCFGENLTVEGPALADMRIGSRLRVGSVLLEVTAPRIPCATFAAHMQDQGFVKRFRQMRRPGLYTRVLEPGQVQEGDGIELEPGAPDAPTVAEEFELFYTPRPTLEQLRRSLAAPIAVRARQHREEQLRELEQR